MTPLTSEKLRGTAASILISTGFALAWGLSGSFALPGSWRVVALTLVVLSMLLLAASAFRFLRAARHAPAGKDKEAHPDPFRTPSYRVSVIAMVLAFPIAGRVLNMSGHSSAVMPVIAIIVGLHFLGLVRAFRSAVFGWVALAFCLVGVAALFLPVRLGDVALRQAVVGLGCAAILLVAALPLTLRTQRALAKAPAQR